MEITRIKMKENQEFADEFNKKLKEAFEIYEKKQKKKNLKKLKKSKSQINNFYKTESDKFPSLSKDLKNISKIEQMQYSPNITGFSKPPYWKPPKGCPAYFEDFKCLHNQYELDDWEKVCKYLLN